VVPNWGNQPVLNEEILHHGPDVEKLLRFVQLRYACPHHDSHINRRAFVGRFHPMRIAELVQASCSAGEYRADLIELA